jgi:hypothetical protein
MGEFQVVKRTSIPNAREASARAVAPKARIHKNGTLYLSVLAIEALGVDQDSRVIVEFDAESRILRLTITDKLPVWLTEDDTFLLRLRLGSKGAQRPLGMVCLRALLSYIGFGQNGGSQEVQIVDLDPQHRSVSVVLPAEQSCDGSSH